MSKTHRSRTGPKLYPVTDERGRFKDIRAYRRARRKAQKLTRK